MSRVTSTPTMQPQTPTMGKTPQPTHEQIQVRAYEKWCKKGRPEGSHFQDWVEAEQELKRDMAMGVFPGTQRR